MVFILIEILSYNMVDILTGNVSARRPWYSTFLTPSRPAFVRTETGRAGNARRPRRVRASASLPLSNGGANDMQGMINDFVAAVHMFYSS